MMVKTSWENIRNDIDRMKYNIQEIEILSENLFRLEFVPIWWKFFWRFHDFHKEISIKNWRRSE